VHVAVVDPGVGSERRALCIETATALLVGPDNGLLSLAAPPAAVRRTVELREERHLASPRSATFHGRDVFAPVAAALATGGDVDAPVQHDPVWLSLPDPLRGRRGVRPIRITNPDSTPATRPHAPIRQRHATAVSREPAPRVTVAPW
jgi:hypothetical protein